MEHEFPCDDGKCVDIIVIDATWQQARRTHSTRYIVSEQQGGPLQARTGANQWSCFESWASVTKIFRDLQNKWRHWKQRTRLVLRDLAANDGVDLSWNDEMEKNQQIANQAAIEERYVWRKV
jgi:hypothetical protein